MGKAGKKRADLLLVEQGLVETREKSRALILAGLVFTEKGPVKKAGDAYVPETAFRIKGPLHPYASRGGIKLAHALDHFRFDPLDRVALDVGASTGGFTSCLLLRGAKKVYAVDVGRAQLAWSLRNDPRVLCMEKQNARYLTPSLFETPPAFVVCDVSFISLRKILPSIVEVVLPSSPMVLLIKPQFEVRAKDVGKGGVVRDPEKHKQVCEGISEFASSLGCQKLSIVPSPITGPAGNREFLLGGFLPDLPDLPENSTEKSGEM